MTLWMAMTLATFGLQNSRYHGCYCLSCVQTERFEVCRLSFDPFDLFCDLFRFRSHFRLVWIGSYTDSVLTERALQERKGLIDWKVISCWYKLCDVILRKHIDQSDMKNCSWTWYLSAWRLLNLWELCACSLSDEWEIQNDKRISSIIFPFPLTIHHFPSLECWYLMMLIFLNTHK